MTKGEVGDTYLVDSNDQLGLLHSSEMLNSTRDSDGEVELGSNDLGRGEDRSRQSRSSFEGNARKQQYLSSLSDLQVVVGVSSVDGGSRGSDSWRRKKETRRGERRETRQIVASERNEDGGVSDSPAPSASARGSIISAKVSLFFNARPPDTTFPAEPRSGRAEIVSLVETYETGAVRTKGG